MPAVSSNRAPFAPPVRRLNPDIYLPFIPQNENGVVYIFALAASRLGFKVKRVQAGFPDCTAEWAGKKVRIEFEFRSRNFGIHGHDPRKCDLIVCWKHDWPSPPSGLQVLELRKMFGLARDVFMIVYRDQFWRELPRDRKPTNLWSVPSTCGPDDLLLIYRPAEPDDSTPGAVTDVFRVITPPERVDRPGWRDEPDWMASIQRVARLRSPITFARLRKLRAHGGIEARPRRTEEWPALHRVLTREGRPTHSLARYAPVPDGRGRPANG